MYTYIHSNSLFQVDPRQMLVIDQDLQHRLILLANIPDRDRKVQLWSLTEEVYLRQTIGIPEVYPVIDKLLLDS